MAPATESATTPAPASAHSVLMEIGLRFVSIALLQDNEILFQLSRESLSSLCISSIQVFLVEPVTKLFHRINERVRF
jgi:hypothetical protein